MTFLLLLILVICHLSSARNNDVEVTEEPFGESESPDTQFTDLSSFRTSKPFSPNPPAQSTRKSTLTTKSSTRKKIPASPQAWSSDSEPTLTPTPEPTPTKHEPTSITKKELTSVTRPTEKTSVESTVIQTIKSKEVEQTDADNDFGSSDFRVSRRPSTKVGKKGNDSDTKRIIIIVVIIGAIIVTLFVSYIAYHAFQKRRKSTRTPLPKKTPSFKSLGPFKNARRSVSSVSNESSIKSDEFSSK